MSVFALNKSKSVVGSGLSSLYQITFNSSLRVTRGWHTKAIAQSEFDHFLLNHSELEQKDTATAFIPGALRADRRLKSDVESLSALVLDLDRGRRYHPNSGSNKCSRSVCDYLLHPFTYVRGDSKVSGSVSLGTTVFP